MTKYRFDGIEKWQEIREYLTRKADEGVRYSGSQKDSEPRGNAHPLVATHR
jgi:hypothetical protein